MNGKNIAVIGASNDRSKFGNKCVRAYLSKGYSVFPVNPKEEKIEGLICYRSISNIKEKIDIVSIYLLPDIMLKITDEIIKKKPAVVYLNPGTYDKEIEKKLFENGIIVKNECSIVAIGVNAGEL